MGTCNNPTTTNQYLLTQPFLWAELSIAQYEKLESPMSTMKAMSYYPYSRSRLKSTRETTKCRGNKSTVRPQEMSSGDMTATKKTSVWNEKRSIKIKQERSCVQELLLKLHGPSYTADIEMNTTQAMVCLAVVTINSKLLCHSVNPTLQQYKKARNSPCSG